MLQTAVSTAPEMPLQGRLGELEALSNEALYAALVANEALLNPGLELLVHRLKPIIISASRGYLPVLSWDLSDAILLLPHPPFLNCARQYPGKCPGWMLNTLAGVRHFVERLELFVTRV